MLQEIKLRASNLADASSEVIMRGIIDSLNVVSNTLRNNGPNKRPIEGCNCDYCKPLRMYTEFALFKHHVRKLCKHIDIHYNIPYDSIYKYIIFINNRFRYIGLPIVSTRNAHESIYMINNGLKYYEKEKNLILHQTKNK